MINHWVALPFCVTAVAGTLLLCQMPLLAANVVRNGGFEDGAAGWRWINSRQAAATGAVDASVAHTGRAAYKITNASGLGPDVYCQLYQEVGVKPNTSYQISAWCKGEGVRGGRLQADRQWTFIRGVPEDDFDWVRVAGIYITGAEQTTLPVMVQVENTTQALWVDDLEVTEWSEAQKHARIYVRPSRGELLAADRLLVAPHERYWERAPVIQFRSGGDAALGAAVRATCNETGLILRVAVKDPTPGPAGSGPDMYALDSIQIGIETRPGAATLTPGYAATTFELGFALAATGTVNRVAWQPQGFDFNGVEASGKRAGDGYGVEILIPWRNLGLDPFPNGWR